MGIQSIQNSNLRCVTCNQNIVSNSRSYSCSNKQVAFRNNKNASSENKSKNPKAVVLAALVTAASLFLLDTIAPNMLNKIWCKVKPIKLK